MPSYTAQVVYHGKREAGTNMNPKPEGVQALVSYVPITATDLPTATAAAAQAFQNAWVAAEQARYTGANTQIGEVPSAAALAQEAPKPQVIRMFNGTIAEATS